MTLESLLATSLGLHDYRATWALQRGLAEARTQCLAPNIILLVEHPHTFTLGRRGIPANLYLDAAGLARRKATVVLVDRGGDITYHGPGQLVAYPIVHLGDVGGDVVRYVRMLEEVAIQTAAAFGIVAERRTGTPGVWVGSEKLCAIGVRVTRMVTTHGIALNVAPDMSYFADILPCGLSGLGVTSFAQLLSAPPAMPAVQRAMLDAFASVFYTTPCLVSPAEARALALPAPPEPAPSRRQLGEPAA
jgi:lipoate-protein ligase B